MKSGDLVVSRHAYPDARSIVRKGCVLAFFSVVASYSNLSTFYFRCKDSDINWNNYNFSFFLT